jgi:hypothetical protein
MQNDEHIARHVRAIYNYQVGQKVGLGVVLLVAGIAAGAVFFVASMISMLQQILAGLHTH